MSAEHARQRYLQRHIEPGLPPCPQPLIPWRQVLVIPAYREGAALLQHLQKMPAGAGRTLVILVLNRPDSDPDPQANKTLREAASRLLASTTAGLQRLNSVSDLYLYDLDLRCGPIPRAQGVGMARKLGCDIAFKWMCEGGINAHWMHCTDADSLLPTDYFQQLDTAASNAAAAVYPFWHAPGGDHNCDLATALYELRLHHYVLGLEYAGSPYAWHTLGSCLAVTFDGYAQVRGCPKRDGGEDFYLLNKLAKTGPVLCLAGTCIQLESRISRRVPFGTGPAVAKISAAEKPLQLPLYYHPACFVALCAVLKTVPRLMQLPLADLPTLLAAQALPQPLQQACLNTINRMGLAAAIDHCRQQGKTLDQFLRQFHQWFDAFRTLKFIHGIRDAGWPDCSFAALPSVKPWLWPLQDSAEIEGLRLAAAQHWGWSR